MFSKRLVCSFFLWVLIRSFTLIQQTDGNKVSSTSTEAATGQNLYYFFYKPTTYPRDCKEVLDQCSGRNSSGVFSIKPDGYREQFKVFCNNSLDYGGWTVVMRRLDGSVAFSRNWAEYKEGFGFLGSEFWLGNEKLSFLTNQRRYELRIDVVVSNGTVAFMTYSYFRVNDDWGNYSLVSLEDARGNTDFLTPTCPTNMIYKNCTCERTCGNPTTCQINCQEAKRCICPDGFFLRGRDCVTPEECECYSNLASKVIPVGESHVDNQCSSRCSCSESGLACSDYDCDPNANCTTTSEGGRCACITGFVGDGLDCGCNPGYLVDESSCRRPRDCDEVQFVEGFSGSGLYYILPSDWQEFRVYCNMSEGRWTVFQRRILGSGSDFYLPWNSYKTGFGELDKDFWLENDKIHYLTSQKNYQLRIGIIDNGDRHYKAQYNGFRIDNEGNKYRLTVLGIYSGNAGYDAMRDHFNQPFSTHDQDNDDFDGYYCPKDFYNYYCYINNNNYGGDCAGLHRGAWWYKQRNRVSTSSECDRFYYYDCCDSNCNNCRYWYSCAFSNLNGQASGETGQTIFWHGLTGDNCGIKFTEMKIRPL